MNEEINRIHTVNWLFDTPHDQILVFFPQCGWSSSFTWWCWMKKINLVKKGKAVKSNTTLSFLILFSFAETFIQIVRNCSFRMLFYGRLWYIPVQRLEHHVLKSKMRSNWFSPLHYNYSIGPNDSSDHPKISSF